MAPPEKKSLLIAFGGNALIQKGQVGTAEEQFENLKIPMVQIARLSADHRIVLTHGNGPQVGNLMIQQESCPDLPRMPLEVLVAQTQGQIGYMIESTLDEELMKLGLDIDQNFITLLTYVVVDGKDPGFTNPTKPIGPVFSPEVAARLNYPTKKTAKGYRRVVASPEPLTVIQRREIKKLIQAGFIVICCGGGGIPVKREGRTFQGVDAVIDKDLVSATLATEVQVESLIIATDVDGVYLDYGTPEQKLVTRLTPAQGRELLTSGALPTGSMGPKVEAAVRFVENGGQRSVICAVTDIEKAARGEAGTIVEAERT